MNIFLNNYFILYKNIGNLNVLLYIWEYFLCICVCINYVITHFFNLIYSIYLH